MMKSFLSMFLVGCWLVLQASSSHAAETQTLSAATNQTIPHSSVTAKLTNRLSVLEQLDPTLAATVRRAYDTPAAMDEPEATAVRNSMGFPWRYVGYLEIDLGNNQIGTCTGTLISRHIVLTAAHCVYNNGTVHQKIRYFPALERKKALLGTYSVKQVLLAYELSGSLDNNLDVALLVLNDSPYTASQFRQGKRVPIGVVGDKHFSQSRDDYPLALVAAGYPTLDPDDPKAGQLVARATARYRNSAENGKGNQFEHRAITKEGTSGGPIFAVDPLYNQFALVGLISAQRTWPSGDVWAVGIKINPANQQRIRTLVSTYEPDMQVKRRIAAR